MLFKFYFNSKYLGVIYDAYLFHRTTDNDIHRIYSPPFNAFIYIYNNLLTALQSSFITELHSWIVWNSNPTISLYIVVRFSCRRWLIQIPEIITYYSYWKTSCGLQWNRIKRKKYTKVLVIYAIIKSGVI